MQTMIMQHYDSCFGFTWTFMTLTQMYIVIQGKV